MNKEEVQTRVEDMKERMLISFLKGLENLAFVKSTDSVTGEVEEFRPAVEDMEAVIRISGQWDREDLKNFITSRTL